MTPTIVEDDMFYALVSGRKKHILEYSHRDEPHDKFLERRALVIKNSKSRTAGFNVTHTELVHTAEVDTLWIHSVELEYED